MIFFNKKYIKDIGGIFRHKVLDFVFVVLDGNFRQKVKGISFMLLDEFIGGNFRQ
jgi:hypothetical protein